MFLKYFFHRLVPIGHVYFMFGLQNAIFAATFDGYIDAEKYIGPASTGITGLAVISAHAISRRFFFSHLALCGHP